MKATTISSLLMLAGTTMGQLASPSTTAALGTRATTSLTSLTSSTGDGWVYPYPTSVDTNVTPTGFPHYTTTWYLSSKATPTVDPTGTYSWGPVARSPKDNIKVLLNVHYDMDSKDARDAYSTTCFVLFMLGVISQVLVWFFYDFFRDLFKSKDSELRNKQAMEANIPKGQWFAHFLLLTSMVIFGLGALPTLILTFPFKNRKGIKNGFVRFGKECSWILCCCSPNHRPTDEELRLPHELHQGVRNVPPPATNPPAARTTGATGATGGTATGTTTAKAPAPAVKRTVTYQAVRDFIPNYSLAQVYYFDYTKESNSFNRIIPLNRVKTLPWYTEADAPSGSDHVCVICLEEFQESSVVNVLPCHHYFHKKCIDKMKSARGSMPTGGNNPATANDALDLRCPMCQLSLLRHFLYYKMYGLDPATSPYDPKQ